jgi:hypothetical protein
MVGVSDGEGMISTVGMRVGMAVGGGTSGVGLFSTGAQALNSGSAIITARMRQTNLLFGLENIFDLPFRHHFVPEILAVV